MSLSAFISERAAGGRKLLAPYLCFGFPEPPATLPLLEALADAGADLIELGIPFSDPLADGPVLQAASQRALGSGATLEGALAVAEAFSARRPDVPLVLMSYANPLLAFGAQRLAEAARHARIAALLVPDLPPESWGLLQRPGLPPLAPFAAPNTPEPRLEALGRLPAPFLYAVNVLGVTGARGGLEEGVPGFLARARRRSGLPVLAGFGVSVPEQAARLAQACEGVILGSALARALADTTAPVETARAFLGPFRAALDAVEAPCC